MFIKLTNGLLYGVGRRGKDKYIFTHQKEKADSSFVKEGDTYTKVVTLEDESIDECFEINSVVIMDVGIEGAPTEWLLDGDSDVLKGKIVLHGRAWDGWTSHGRGEGYKEVGFDDVKGQSLKKLIYKEKGKKYWPPKVQKLLVSKEEFKKGVLLYNLKNI